MTTSAPSHRLAYVLLVLTALFWSGNFVLARAMHAAVPPMTLSFMRWLIAFALLAPFSLRHAWRERALLWQCRGRILALSLLGITAFNSLVYTGVQTTTATNASSGSTCSATE
jgi:drug/metabolite transporter (DMT)-like permease